MNGNDDALAAPRFLTKDAFQQIVPRLKDLGYTVVGPTVADDAIVYAELNSVDELPIGWSDEQQPGQYRIERGAGTERVDGESHFDFSVGPHSWKSYLFPPRAILSEARHTAEGWQFARPADPPPKYAFLGVRGCELAAMRIQDRVFMSGDYVDRDYSERRREAFIIAVNCTSAASTCFCTSMGTGPSCESGFDIVMTELPAGFVVAAATAEGDELLAALPTEQATIEQRAAAKRAERKAEAQIERRLDTTNIRDLLMTNLEHSRWDEVAARCLSCTNCTMVCPTCFCSSVDEVSDLAGDHVQRRRQWDSCFNWGFSYVNGGNVRDSIRARYRQWLTHKLGSWIDQFGESGCVGCGRCITWCPVGIDLTEEVAALRGEESN